MDEEKRQKEAEQARDAEKAAGQESPEENLTGQEQPGEDQAGQEQPGEGQGGEEQPETEETSQEKSGEEKTPDPADDGKTASEKKGLFHKKEKKDKRDQQIEELTDRVKRQMAEFDNFRKRTEREKASMFEMGSRSVIEKILPVVDNFERGLAAVPEGERETPVATGMDKIYKQLLTVLEELGVKPIEAVGQPFDPAFHNAVMHVEDESLGDSVVAEEFQKGYLYHDSVIRHSMVKVAN